MPGLLSKIKSDAKKAGSNKSKIFYVREGEKKRVRFLQDADDGLEYTFHDSYEAGVNVPCQEHFGKSCPYCDDESMRTRSQYAWSIWDYDAKEVKLFMFPVNNCTPIPPLMALYDTYGTITDRDYVISVSGKQQNKSYSVVPMDKAKFRNDRAKPLSQKAVNDILQKAYPCDSSSDEEEVKPTRKPSTKPAKPAEEEAADEDSEYATMTARELYNLCKEREIDAEPKKKPEYYIGLLEDDDAQNGAEEEEEDDDWGDEEEEQAIDYSEFSAKELYGMCKDREIECLPKKPAKYYVTLLEEDDKVHDDWEEEEDEEDGDWEE